MVRERPDGRVLFCCRMMGSANIQLMEPVGQAVRHCEFCTKYLTWSFVRLTAVAQTEGELDDIRDVCLPCGEEALRWFQRQTAKLLGQVESAAVTFRSVPEVRRQRTKPGFIANSGGEE